MVVQQDKDLFDEAVATLERGKLINLLLDGLGENAKLKDEDEPNLVLGERLLLE